MYIIKTKRLGLRAWSESDLKPMHEICSDTRVMEYFPMPLSLEATQDLIERLKEMYDTHGYCYYAVDHLQTGDMIGMIGLAYQDYVSPYTPGTDIGWRLHPEYWGLGLATEGAAACLDYAWQYTDITSIFSICAESNAPSERVMQKIGMNKVASFDHPALVDYPHIQRCSAYAIKKPDSL